MIRTRNEQVVENKCIRGGIGEVIMHKLINSDEELAGKGRMFNHMTLLPGNTIGYHMHNGDNEYFYILSGNGLYNDNGTEVRVQAGDALVCRSGESHGFVNDTDKPLEFLALILYN